MCELSLFSLQRLCEEQFECNMALRNNVSWEEPFYRRTKAVGVDREGRRYWLLQVCYSGWRDVSGWGLVWEMGVDCDSRKLLQVCSNGGRGGGGRWEGLKVSRKEVSYDRAEMVAVI